MRSNLIGMCSAVAAVAVAGSASAAIVDSNGIASNCLTFNPSTDTTITYTGFSGNLVSTLTVGFSVESSPYSPSTVGIGGLTFTNIQYSTNAGSSWNNFSNGTSFTTNSTYNAMWFFDGNATTAKNTAGALQITGLNNMNGANLYVRATLSATNLIPNDYKLVMFAYRSGDAGGTGGRTSTAVPAPGAAALVGVAGLVAARRRKA
jgi:hypothetical protein